MLRTGQVAWVGARVAKAQREPARTLAKRVRRRKRPFDKILVANRGEIAVRVIRTARDLGIKTVAIYSEPDRHAKHVLLADEAYCVGPAASSESYLNMPRILEVVKESGAQAVHPGYGFLSENHEFAELLEANGVAFVGPNSRAITAMGDKIESKKIAKEAGVSVIPGFVGTVAEDEVVKVCQDIGYPVMIKASAGGGGKGMRIARSDEEAREGYRLSKHEAKSSFGDDRILIEKFIENPRHIEIQVLGDKHGTVVAFPERECSIQRRNQKVIEEAPSTLLDPDTRAAMQAQAIALSQAVGYDSAGTIEMLCDPDKNFYFLEMNTRLQVEHPVTEMISGEDLVEHMLRVAAGEPLPSRLTEKPIPIDGWAVEARVYAEDPIRGFLPSTGLLKQYREPGGDGIRCDSGILEGSEISMFYDPMICKLIAHAPTREEANTMLAGALDQYIIRGVTHNIPFMRDVLRSPRYQEGRLSTKYIEEEYPDGFSGVVLDEDERVRLAALVAIIDRQRAAMRLETSGKLPSAEALEVSGMVYVTVEGSEEPYAVALELEDGGEQVDEDGEEVPPRALVHFEGREEPLEVLAHEWTRADPIVGAFVDRTPAVAQVLDVGTDWYRMSMNGAQVRVTVREEAAQRLSAYMIPKPEVDMSKVIVSPMPGLLVSVNVQPGDRVEAGQEVAVVEAMKMQNVLRAEKAGVVKAVALQAGATMSVDELIVEFE